MSLAKFIGELHDKECSFKLPAEEVKDLEDVVTYVVKTFLPSVISQIPGCKGKYTIAEIINAGSYFEQTKIKEPNEFDFMVVVEELSDSSEVLFEKGCIAGYTKAKVRNIDRWPISQPHQTAEHSFELSILQFNAYVRQALELTTDLPFRGNLGELSFNKVVSRGKPYKEFSFVQTAYFTWRIRSIREKERVEVFYPRSEAKEDRPTSAYQTNVDDVYENVEILYDRCRSTCQTQMEYGHGHDAMNVTRKDSAEVNIDIDLMTCCHASLDTIRQMVQVNNSVVSLLQKNGCHVVLKPCGNSICREADKMCRLISYTKSEQELMRNLSVDWKICLKWIFISSELLGIDTYKLKTSVLYLSNRESSTEDSVLSILQYLKLCHSRGNMPSFFNSVLNVWNIQPCFRYFVGYHLTLLEKILQGIRDTPSSEYDYDVYLSIINQWTIQFSKVVPTLLDIEKGFNLSELAVFNGQGNAFIDVVRGIEPVLSQHKQFKNIPRQMKFLVFIDVVKILLKLLCMKIWSVIKLVFCPWLNRH